MATVLKDSDFRSSRIPGMRKFNPATNVYLVRKKITCEIGTFNVGEAFLVKQAKDMGFTDRKIRLFFEHKMIINFPDGFDASELIDAAKEKISEGLLEVATKKAAQK